MGRHNDKHLLFIYNLFVLLEEAELYVINHILITPFKPVFHLANLFARTSKKRI